MEKSNPNSIPDILSDLKKEMKTEKVEKAENKIRVDPKERIEIDSTKLNGLF